jgi:hypothetical protein
MTAKKELAGRWRYCARRNYRDACCYGILAAADAVELAHGSFHVFAG